jgi:hypothetical protein
LSSQSLWAVSDLGVILVVSLHPALTLAQSLRNPLEFQIRYLRSLRFHDTPSQMRHGSLWFLVWAAAFIYAGVRAELSVLWFTLAALFAIGALPLLLVPLVASRVKYRRLEESPPPSEATLIRRRRWAQVTQAFFLALWLYSWRGLAA